MKLCAIVAWVNPFSMGYYAYIACVKSWLKLVDKLFILEGGSNDETMKKLYKHLNVDEKNKIEVIKNDITRWATNNRFHLAQQTVSWNYALEKLCDNYDWGVLLNGDYVFDSVKDSFYKELNMYKDEIFLTFKRKKGFDENYKEDYRGVLLNLNRIRNINGKVCFGFNEKNDILLDFPIIAKSFSVYTDNGKTHKFVYKGLLLKSDKKISLESYIFGHFFFTREQCIYKCKRWAEAVARYYGYPLRPEDELLISNNIFNIIKTYSLDYLLKKEFPDEIKNVLKQYYSTDMLCNYTSKKLWYFDIYLKFLKLGYACKKIIKRLRGLKGLRDYHKWYDIKTCCDKFDVCDLEKVYTFQDKYLQ